MYGHHNRLLIIILSALVIAFIAGCTQPDDILAPVASTKIILTPARLPSPPPGMVYEIWLVDKDGGHKSLGKFNWDSKMYRFLDTTGNRIDSLWTVNFDVLKYRRISLTVEQYPDPYPDSMGPIMLSDTLVAPENKSHMKMEFPVNFWTAMAGYSITTPTDGDSRSKPASGIWFSLYVFDSLRYDDTVDVRLLITSTEKRPLNIDTTFDYSKLPPDIIRIDTLNLDTLRLTTDTLAITNEGRDTNFNYIIYLDTFTHITCNYDFVSFPVNVTPDTQVVIDTLYLIKHLTGPPRDSAYSEIDTFKIAPFTDYIHARRYDTIAHPDTLDRFLDNSTDLPSLDGTGWHYKGWVISPYLTPVASFGKLTRPSWLPGTIDYWITPSNAGLITTGSFKSFAARDDRNRYSLKKRVPSFPGEDFLNADSLPAGLGPRGIYFADSLNRNDRAGTVIISLEPDNYNNDSTNFPLILMTAEGLMPSYRTITDDGDFEPRTQDYRMMNWFRMVDNDPTGFPAIQVKIVRE